MSLYCLPIRHHSISWLTIEIYIHSWGLLLIAVHCLLLFKSTLCCILFSINESRRLLPINYFFYEFQQIAGFIKITSDTSCLSCLQVTLFVTNQEWVFLTNMIFTHCLQQKTWLGFAAITLDGILRDLTGWQMRAIIKLGNFAACRYNFRRHVLMLTLHILYFVVTAGNAALISYYKNSIAFFG